MRKKTILAALTIVMMLFTMIPATVSAAQPKDETNSFPSVVLGLQM